MEAYRAIVDKRDQRAFLATPVPEAALQRILQAGRMTGSSKNSEPNRFVVVRDRERLAGLAKLLDIPATIAVNRVIALGYVDPQRAAAPATVARRRLPLTELVHWERW
ncbi:MAG: nitroreductase family protein [Candidatus Rokuibacteriota bacterium]